MPPDWLNDLNPFQDGTAGNAARKDVDNLATWSGLVETGNDIAGAAQARQIQNLANVFNPGTTVAERGGQLSFFESLGDQATEASHGPLAGIFESPAMQIGGRAASGVLGGLQFADGVNEAVHGNGTQGSLDMISGGLGVAAMVQPELAPIALAAGLTAAGNQQTKDWGWWGKNKDGTNRDSLQFVGQTTAGAYNAVDKWAGGGIGGAALGGAAALGTGIGTGALALGGDLVGGVASAGIGLGHLAGDVGGLAVNGAKALGTGVSNLASGAGHVLGGIGNAISHW